MTRRSTGFTLVEVVVASFGLALGLAGVLVAFSALMRTARMVEAESQALHQARQQLEQLRSCSFSASELALGTHSFSGGTYVVSSNAFLATTRTLCVMRDVVAANNATSQVSLTTVLTAVLHQ